MQKPIAKTRGIKVARRVIELATREVEKAFARGEISGEVYRVRMAGIEAERKACGL
jgi:hypothetical protein